MSTRTVDPPSSTTSALTRESVATVGHPGGGGGGGGATNVNDEPADDALVPADVVTDTDTGPAAPAG